MVVLKNPVNEPIAYYWCGCDHYDGSLCNQHCGCEDSN